MGLPVSTTLAGRHALVCGASAGIGAAAAVALGSAGASLTLLARRLPQLQATAAAASAAGAPAVRTLVVDLQQLRPLEVAIADLLSTDGPVHILVNNTGGPPPGALLEADGGALLQAFERHLLASHLLVRAVVPGMRTAQYGRIINVISTSVREPLDGLGVSNTIRAAMAGWAKTLSRELPPGITINNVLPGATDTDRLASIRDGKASVSGQTPQQVVDGWLAGIPEGRLGRPEELGAVIAFLASPAAAYVRGVSLPVDGGRLRSI